jgi:hypothetical protein
LRACRGRGARGIARERNRPRPVGGRVPLAGVWRCASMMCRAGRECGKRECRSRCRVGRGLPPTRVPWSDAPSALAPRPPHTLDRSCCPSRRSHRPSHRHSHRRSHRRSHRLHSHWRPSHPPVRPPQRRRHRCGGRVSPCPMFRSVRGGEPASRNARTGAAAWRPRRRPPARGKGNGPVGGEKGCLRLAFARRTFD